MAKKKAESGTPANGQQRPTPAYFLSLSLENVRCFGAKQTLDLSDGSGKPARWTVLLGNNGTGKTTVLQAAVVTGDPVVVDIQITEVKQTAIFAPYASSRAGFPRTMDDSATFEASFTSSPDPRLVQIRSPGPGSTITHSPADKARPKDFYPPLIVGYGASRRLGSGVIVDERSHRSAPLFDEVPLINAEEWLVRLDYSSSKPSPLQQRGKTRLTQIIRLLIDILPDVEDIRFVVEGDVMPTARVEFHTKYGWVPMRQLGYGYQTVIAWMVDLAARMVERYPDSPDPLAEPVIVLVDEIDLHLHPTWQRSLIAKLDERFPKAQFIVTAHSPLVVQAAPNANLAVLRREGDQVVIDNDVDAIRNWRVDQILTSELFGLPTARPPQIEKDMARRVELLSKGKLTAAEKKEVESLEERIGYLPSGETAEQAKMMELLHQTLDVLMPEAKKRP